MVIAYYVNGLNYGGIESFLVNVINNFNCADNERIIVITNKDETFDYEKKLLENGVKIIKIGKTTPLKKFKMLCTIFRKEHVDVLHCNVHLDAAGALIAAWVSGVKKRITHSHTTSFQTSRIKHFIYPIIIRFLATDKIACGEEAGLAYYKNNSFTIIENGINTNEFLFSQEKRRAIRNEFGFDDDVYVIGHVGRIVGPKNHKMLINIFAEYHKRNPKSKLLIVGDGELAKDIKKQIKQLSLSKDALLVGNRSDTASFYSAFDCLVFPSLLEGLPVTLIEAQANGLKIFASDTIDKSVNITNTISFYSLEESPEMWAEHIEEKIPGLCNRYDNKRFINQSQYNINNVVNKLKKVYFGERYE